MKIVSLNIWGGRVHDALMEFFRVHSDIDIFCLQEVYHEASGKDTIWKGANFNALKDISAVLHDYVPYYHPHLENWWGLAMFVKKELVLEGVDEAFVHLYKRHDLEQEKLGHTAKNIQYAKTMYNGKPLTVINFHGLWNGKGKTDCEERLVQSKNISMFLQKLEGEVVLCGDFNLLPDTRSMQIIEETGLRNLVSEYGVISTRTSLYTKPERFADYAFVSKGLTVKNFSVLPNEVSDHSPLLVEIA